MAPDIRITHKPTNKVREFDNLRDAGAWYAQYQELKMEVADLEIQAPVHLSAFAPNIPEWLSDLMLRVEQDYGSANNRIVPKIRFSSKEYRKNSTGRTFFADHTFSEITHVSIVAGYDIGDVIGVTLHELAHVITKAGHNRYFYRTLFEMIRKYMPAGEAEYVKGEFAYKTSSRYWYAEMYNIRSILAEYGQPVYRAPKKTEQQKADDAFAIMFGKDA